MFGVRSVYFSNFFIYWINDLLLVFQLAPLKSQSVVKALDYLENPREKCDRIYALMQSLTDQIHRLLSSRPHKRKLN